MGTVIVVGGGVIGCFIAIELATQGLSVILVDSRPALMTGASRAGFGSLTPYSDPYFKGSARRFAHHSVQLYRTLWIPRLTDAAGEHLVLGDDGLLDLYSTDEALLAAQHLHDELLREGYSAQMLSRDDVLRLEPALGGEFGGALLLDEPWIDREKLASAMTRVIGLSGNIRVMLGRRVSSVLGSSEQAHVSVALENQESLDADFVVVCSGAGPGVDSLGEIEPELIMGEAVVVAHPSGKQLLRRHVYKGEAFITPRVDGRLLLGATYERLAPSERPHDTFSDRANARTVAQLLEVNTELIPAIAECDVVGLWRGYRPRMLDGAPLLGPYKYPRLIVANGFVGLGLTMAPAVAEAVAEYVITGELGRTPAEFSTSRFSRHDVHHAQ